MQAQLEVRLNALRRAETEVLDVLALLDRPATATVLGGCATLPDRLPSVLDISIYLFVNAMTTVSAVIFLYSPDTTLASVAVLNMDDAGDIAPAAAMGMMIFYTNVIARLIHTGLSSGVLKRTQAWRTRGA